MFVIKDFLFIKKEIKKAKKERISEIYRRRAKERKEEQDN